MFEILLSRGYSENNFREDLKSLYLKLGLENKTVMFLFTDAHVAEEGFLELINNMLTSGGLSGCPCCRPALPTCEAGQVEGSLCPRGRHREGPMRGREAGGGDTEPGSGHLKESRLCGLQAMPPSRFLF